jgi:glycosyltransferase involved in cell wall biosynthesis
MLVSIIIPCKDEKQDTGGLLEDISKQQKSFDTEAIKMIGISPPGKARNEGVKKAKGEILVFVDCDIRLGNELFLAHLIQPLLVDKAVGLSGASIRIPPDANRFQIRYAREVPHCQAPLANELTDIQVAPSACCAIYKDLFFKLKGFNEDIIRGEDSVFSRDVSGRGLRVVLAPQAFCFHPQPENFWRLATVNMRDGRGSCLVDTYYPDLNLDVHPKGITYFTERKNIPQRIGRFAFGIITALFNGKFLLFFSKSFYLLGYSHGIIKYRLLRCRD